MNFFNEPLLLVYRWATGLFGLVAPAFLEWRRWRGKEDPARLSERMGRARLSRPGGPLVWMHGASVGEGLALLPLVDAMIASGFRVLVTTGTVTSARVLSQRLPAGAIHQYLPIDAPAFVRRFYAHWRPQMALLAESELWPNLLCEAGRRAIPVILVNARMSPQSFGRWRRLPALIGPLLRRIDLALAQSRDDGRRLEDLGARNVRVAGNLKYDVPPPPVNPSVLADMLAAVGSRPVWLAAQTHPAEEAIVIDAHRSLSKRWPDLLTIVAPRHVERGPQIEALARGQGIAAELRSRGETIGRSSGFYIADTMGELGLFYRIAGLVFVGKSLGGASGGQNPIEPANLGAAVLHGPDVGNFTDVYAALDSSGGAKIVSDAAHLDQSLAVLLADPARSRALARAGADAVARLGGATDRIMNALEPYIARILGGRME